MACFVLFATSGLFAQNQGFGSITGVVQDSTGAVVGGAKVVVENTSKGIRRELETSSAGIFNAPALVPATGYTVTVTKAGFANYLVKDVQVEVGNSVDVRVALKVGTTGTEVMVTGEAPTVDFTKTDTSAVVGSKQILELPINGRRVDAFVNLTPGVTNDGAFGLLSFRGNPGGNSFTTDGVDTTNSYYGENAGRTRTYNISQDAVQEFQVVSSNYAAEFGKAAGGVVNTVTRSGSNTWHGSAYEFFRNRTLNSIDFTTKTSATGAYPNGINPPEVRNQFGGSIGGPIIKNKLFFFGNAEFFRRTAPAVSSNIGAGAGNNIFNGDGTIKSGTPYTSGDQVCRAGGTVKLPSSSTITVPGPTQAQCDAASAYLTSRVLTQLIPRTMTNNMGFAKLDWHPSNNDSLSFSGNYLDFVSPNGIQTQLSLTNGNAIGNNADTSVYDRTGRGSWTRIVTPNMVNEVRFGIFKDRQLDPASTSLIPSFGAAGPSPTALSVNSVSNLGFATNYPRLNPSELRVEFGDNLSWTKGQHTMKFGALFSHLEDYVESMLNQYPTYTYTPVTSGSTVYNALTLFARDFNGGVPAGSQSYSQYSQTVGNRVVNFDLWEISAYAQDEWHATPKLTISPGLRFEHSGVPQPVTCNPNFPDTCRIPKNNNNTIAPRIGFSYAINDKTVIRGGYGMFNNRYITSSIQNMFVTNGVYQYQYSYSGSSITPTTLACLPSFPQVEPWSWQPSGSCARTLSPNIFMASSNYRPSYSQQGDLAIERQLARNVSLSASYVWSRTLHLPVSYDDNVLAPTTSRTYLILGSTDTAGAAVDSYTTPVYTARNPKYIFNGTQYSGRVIYLDSSANSYYNALLVNLKYRRSNWLQFDASYTYGHTIDWGIGSAPTFGNAFPSSYYNRDYQGETGSSTLDRRQNLIVNYVFAPKFTHSTGAFAKYLVNGWQISGVTQFATSQPIVPTISGSVTGLLFSGGTLNGLNSTSRVPFMSLSALNVGPIYRTDARLVKNFPITERVNITAGIEAFNLFNTVIPSGRDSAAFTFASGTGANAGKFVLTPRSTYGTLTTTQITPDGTTARRAQVVARINF